MANVIIKDAGAEKVKVISVYRLITNLGLKEAKEAVDGLEEGREILIPMEGAEQSFIDDVIRRFTEAGAYAYEDKIKINGSSFEEAMKKSGNTTSSDQEAGNKSVEETPRENSVNNSVNVGTLDRDTTMAKLVEAGKVAKELEELSISKGRIVSQINQRKREAENLRGYVPKNNSLWTGPVILMVVSAMTLLLLPLGVVIGLIWYGIKAKKYKENYLLEHQEENNNNAEKYIAENVVPLQNQLADTDNRISYLYESGKVDEAVDFVGEDLFTYGCIEDLYNIIKSRKADNLKEALNLYDDAMHKARMEEMQAAIQNASEIAATEAVKQTQYSKDIAKSSHQAATAAKATAYHTRQVDRNTRQFRK